MPHWFEWLYFSQVLNWLKLTIPKHPTAGETFMVELLQAEPSPVVSIQ
jgi:hypothetical protein